ncbi:MAG: hypothetical protein HZB15_07520 [Actinobacteria bacterium]|nr:hypothetical protein [Actinomycetota bacterium]
MSDHATAILKSTDLERTIEWYQAAGFVLRGRHTVTDDDWCELARGALIVQFASGRTPWPGSPSMTGCFYVPVPDADAALPELQPPVVSEWGVEDRPWGAREVVLRDQDGYVITLTQTL